MTPRNYLLAWAIGTSLVCAFIFAQNQLTLAPLPDASSARWAYRALDAARRGLPLPAAPNAAHRYHGVGPSFVSVHARGERRARYVGQGTLAEVVRNAAEQFAHDEALRTNPDWSAGSVRFRVAVTRASGPLLALPGLDVFSLVPLRDGLAAQFKGQSAYLTPDDLQALGATDRAVAAPVPDLTFGTALSPLRAALAKELGASPAELRQSGKLVRLRIDALPEQSARAQVDRGNLLSAAREGVGFVLRHQEDSGRFTYVYDAQHDESVDAGAYSLARHSGTIFFLARAARELGMPEARSAALRAIEFVSDTARQTCGAPERTCIVQNDRVEMGASALTALACAELLRGGDVPEVRALLVGLLEFLRAQQRPDGELMHEYDRERDQPIDVQHMYYSGEAAMALLSGYEQLHDKQVFAAANRLMGHLTGAGWRFFGARYYYGEEHWTCQAVAKAAAYMPVDSALDFCLRWGAWQSKLQYREGQTPWNAAGAFGVGPVLLPRVTTAASRVEALVPIYRVAQQRGHDVREIRQLVERSLGLLLRMRWAPGPAHLFARPEAAVGGIPSTAADLRSRVDMVQHAGSAMLAWAELLAAGGD